MQPKRPPTVSEDARWQENDQTWVEGAMTNGAQVGTWSAWRADGTPLYRGTYSPRYPGALHGDVDSFAADGTVHRFDRYRHGHHVGSRLVSEEQLDRGPFISENVVRIQTMDGAQRFWQAWLEDSVILVVRTGLVDGAGKQTRTGYETSNAAQQALLKAREEAAELGFLDEADSEEGESEDDAEARRELTALAQKHTAGKKKETPAATVKRLKRFLAAAKKAGWSGLPKLTAPKPWTPTALAKATKRLGITLPAGVLKALKEAGAFELSSNYLRMSIAASPLELDYDTEVGLGHNAEYYADVYGSSFNPKTVEKNFARIALASYVFDDDDPHEDGDIGLVVVNRVGGRAAPAGVWELPHDDGYEHQRRATTVEGFFSWLADRAIRCVALHAVADD